MKTKKKRETRRMIDTGLKGVKATVNMVFRADGTVAISGYLTDGDGIRADEDITYRTTATTISQVDQKVTFTVGRMVEKYNHTHRTKAKVRLTERPYSQAFQSLSESTRRALCPDSWRAESTIRHRLAHLENTMLPLLDEYGMDIEPADCLELRDKLKQKISRHGNSTGDPNYLERAVEDHIRDFNAYYPRFRAFASDYALPEIRIPSSSVARRVQKEQVKSLPIEVTVKLAMAFSKLLETNPLALGGLLMLTSMARTAEVCAPLFKDFLIRDTYAVIAIMQQSDDKITLVDPKTDAGIRIIIFPKIARDAIQKRFDYLLKIGYSSEEVKTMPVVSAADDPRSRAKSTDLSRYIRELISILLPTKDYWSAVESTMLDEKDIENDGKTASKDPSAYVLRRNGCSICCNVCGMDPALVDTLMGHELPRQCRRDWKKYVSRPESWGEIAYQVERFIFDPAHSANPYFRPIELYKGSFGALQASNGFCFRSSNAIIQLRIKSKSQEIDDPIELISPITCTPKMDSTIPCDQNDTCPVIGALRPMEFYDMCRSEIDQMDLSSFS